MFSYFSAEAEADDLKLHHIQFQIVSTKRKICAFTILALMLPFVFSSHRCQTAFLQFGYQPAKKTWGVQRGISPWLWVSNRGEQHPCWHTTLPAKSSVLYLLRPLTRERDCRRIGQAVSSGSRRANICKHGRLADIRSSGVGGAALRRSMTEAAVSPGEQEVYKARRSDASPFS